MTSPFNFDFFGVFNLFGGNYAVTAIKYLSLEKYGIFWSAYLPPGLIVVASKLVKRVNNRLARFLFPGPRDDWRDIDGLMEMRNFSYTGLLSGTRMTVVNRIGEAVL